MWVGLTGPGAVRRDWELWMTSQMRPCCGEVSGGEGGDVWGGAAGMGAVADAPDAAVFLVASGVVAGDFVVGDDAVVPVGDVETAVGAEGDGDGAEHGVCGGDEVAGFFECPDPVRVEGSADGVDFAEDGIGDEEEPVPWGGEGAGAVVGEGHA